MQHKTIICKQNCVHHQERFDEMLPGTVSNLLYLCVSQSDALWLPINLLTEFKTAITAETNCEYNTDEIYHLPN